MQVVAYGISINLVEVTWKSKIKAQFPNPNDYSAFMGDFSTATGAVTFIMMILSRFIFRNFGWGGAALITPTVLLVTGRLLAVHLRLAAGLLPMTVLIFHAFQDGHQGGGTTGGLSILKRLMRLTKLLHFCSELCVAGLLRLQDATCSHGVQTCLTTCATVWPADRAPSLSLSRLGTAAWGRVSCRAEGRAGQ